VNYQLVYDATWLCGSCNGLSRGAELIVKESRTLADLAYDAVLTGGGSFRKVR